MAVFVPAAARPVSEASFASFVQDHVVQGGYRGGKMVLDLMQTVRTSADTTKSEFLRSLPSIARHMGELPGSLGALFSEDPNTIHRVERQIGDISNDIASAATTGMLFGLSKLVTTALPFGVAAGAVLGAAVGSERLDALLSVLREIDKED